MDVVYTFAGDAADPAQNTAHKVNRGRGAGHGELATSLALLLRFCRAQVRRVYIVHGGTMLSAATYIELETAAQLGGFAPEQLVVVPQDDILPPDTPRWCRNSCVIEAHLWRLPRLSEAFLYLNDDMFFGRQLDLRRLYWGSDGVPLLDCCILNKQPENTAQMHCHNAIALHRRRHKHGPSSQLRSVGPVHFPALMLRAACRRAWELYPAALSRMPPLRDRCKTLNFQLLSYLVAIDAGWARVRLLADLRPWCISTAFVEMESKGLQHILKYRPHWVCVNGVGPTNKRRYAKFVQRFLLSSEPGLTRTPPRYPSPRLSCRTKYAIEVGGPVAR
jgi:hypothetical protein